ncbi:MAG TPA: RNA polymerase-binding protein RbpA [Candidatus Stackebrandtia faecavium]|nr:RNA polymerase-binding protein RbpA [Candidatus Stackebrandtia faecavium]
MLHGNAIRATRIGHQSPSRPEAGQIAPATVVTYWCFNGHATRPRFSTKATVPDSWECRRCGLPAGLDAENPPEPPIQQPYKTHMAYVMDRRSREDGEALLAEALANLRARRLD